MKAIDKRNKSQHQKTIREQEEVIRKLEVLLYQKFFDPQSFLQVASNKKLEEQAQLIASLEKQCDALRKELDSSEHLKELNAKTSRENERMKLEIKEYKERNAHHEEEIKNCKIAQTEMKSLLEDKEAEIVRLNTLLENANSRAITNDTHQIVDKAIGQLRKEKEQVVQENQQMKSELETVKKENSSLQRKLSALDHENRDIAARYIDEMHNMRLKLAKINESKEFDEIDFEDDDIASSKSGNRHYY